MSRPRRQPAERAREASPEAPPVEGLLIGRVARVDELGNVEVEVPDETGAADRHPARTTAALRPDDVGRQAALAFEAGRRDRPIVLGLIHDPLAQLASPETPAPAAEPEVQVDDERTVITGEREVVLRCGKASLTLYRDGRVLVRGTNIVSRSSGPNRIKGASIQLN